MTLTLHLQTQPCSHNTDTDPTSSHPNITPLHYTIHTPKYRASPIGTLRAYTFNTAAMRQQGGPAQFWHECQAFDAAHEGTKLDKIENFLANESFPAERQAQIDTVALVLFVDEVFLEKEYRGRGVGLWAVDRLISLHAPAPCFSDDEEEARGGAAVVVLLQAGTISREGVAGGGGVGKADEKLTQYWKRLGFGEWSWSDGAWLCLVAGERVRVGEGMGLVSVEQPGGGE